MDLQRIFLSAAMNPGATSGPSGVAGGVVAPAVPVGLSGTVQFPTVAAGGALLVKNNGPTQLVLFYDDSEPGGSSIWAELAAAASVTGYTSNPVGTVVVHPNSHKIVINTFVGPLATYSGGPFSLIPGSYSYSVVETEQNHPKATVLA